MFEQDNTCTSSRQFPQALIAQSCSGASVTMQVSQEIFAAQGYKVYHGGEPILQQRPHIMKIAKQRLEARNGYDPSQEEVLTESLAVFNERAIEAQGILLFKTRSVNDEVLKTLNKLHTKLVFTFRRNLLDRAICVTRYCFESNLSYEVNYNGTKVNTCFKRRQRSSEIHMVHFTNISALLEQMQHWGNLQLERRLNYERFPNISKLTEYEDLFKFEYTARDDVFDDSVKVWCEFLKTFGEIKESIVQEVLRKYKNSRKSRPSFNATIYNFGKIKDSFNESHFREYTNQMLQQINLSNA